VLKTVYRSSCRDKHNCQRRDSNLDPLTPQSDALTTRPLRPAVEVSRLNAGWLFVGALAVRRVGRYEVVTLSNTAVPDVIVHAAADTKPTSTDNRPTGSRAVVGETGSCIGAYETGSSIVFGVTGGCFDVPEVVLASARPQMVSGRPEIA